MRGKRVHAIDCEVTVRLLNAPSVACPSASGDDSAVDAAKTRPFTLSMSTNENLASTLSSRSFIFRPMARLWLGVRATRARERLSDLAGAERVADQDDERVLALEHLRRVGQAGVGRRGPVAEEGDRAPLQVHDTILGRRGGEVVLDVGPVHR